RRTIKHTLVHVACARRKVACSDNGAYAGHAPGSAYIDGLNACMGMRRAQNSAEQCVRGRDISRVGRRAGSARLPIDGPRLASNLGQSNTSLRAKVMLLRRPGRLNLIKVSPWWGSRDVPPNVLMGRQAL